MTETTYSPLQANAALALVRPIVADIVGHQSRIAELTAAYQRARREPEPSQAALNDARRAISAETAQRDQCVAELADLGVEVKDAATGLVDFPGELEGARVLLCWRLDEDRVEFFHGEAEGYDGRRPIPEPVHSA
jgi:hypothetical protein